MPRKMPTSRPLRGRGEEWAQMLAAMEYAAQSHTTVLVLEGPPGVGKTRLLHELTATAHRRGCPVFEHRGWMAPETVRQRVTDYEYLAGRLTALSTTTVGGPVVVVWDDPQWGRGALLPHLMPTSASSSVLWALASSAEGQRLASPGKTPDVVYLEVAPLDPTAVGEVVADLLDAVPAPDLLALARTAAGNPGRIGDLIAGLRDEHAISVRDGVAHLTATALPRRAGRRLLAPLARLSPDARRLVQVGSAIGASFVMADLADMMRDTAARLLPAIEEALASGLLISDGDRLGFAHELVRAAVAGSVPATVHRALRDEVERRTGGLARAGPTPWPGRGAASEAPSQPWLTAAVDPPSAWDKLSQREQIIARYAGQGLTNRQIASEVYLSPHTVNFHLRQIFRKLKIHRRTELMGLPCPHQPASADARGGGSTWRGTDARR